MASNHINGEVLFYQTSIAVWPVGSLESPMRRVVRLVCKWLRETGAREVADAVASAKPDDLPNLSIPSGYPGTAVDEEGVGECVRAACWHDRSQWAVDYDKPDDKEPLMRWHTSIGVDDRHGMCRVNVRVVTYMLSGYCGLFDPSRSINVPRIVAMLETMDGVMCLCGQSCPLTSRHVPVLESMWDSHFMSSLLDDRREIPLVVVCSSMDGLMPYDPKTLALEFAGVAAVFAIDFSEPWVLNTIYGSFPKGSPASSWRPWADRVCVYQPGVDLSDEASERKMKVFHERYVIRYGADFSRHLRYALLRHGRQNGQVYGTRDLDVGRKDEMRRREVEQLEGKVEKAEQDVEVYLKLAESAMAAEDEGQPRDDAASRALRERADAAEERLMAAEASMRHHQARAAMLEGQLDEREDELARLRTEMAALEGMEHIPTKLSELLDFVEKLYGDRITVVGAARRSAEEFDGKYSLDDEWAILRSIGKDLWDLYFRHGGCKNVVEEYRNRSGFELSLHESESTSKSKKARAARTVRYKGQDLTTEKHVKGRSSSQSSAFRVYYDVDQEERKIVITHCGGHLWTVGTQRRGIG